MQLWCQCLHSILLTLPALACSRKGTAAPCIPCQLAVKNGRALGISGGRAALFAHDAKLESVQASQRAVASIGTQNGASLDAVLERVEASVDPRALQSLSERLEALEASQDRAAAQANARVAAIEQAQATCPLGWHTDPVGRHAWPACARAHLDGQAPQPQQCTMY